MNRMFGLVSYSQHYPMYMLILKKYLKSQAFQMRDTQPVFNVVVKYLCFIDSKVKRHEI